jgi:hypothetical protein
MLGCVVANASMVIECDMQGLVRVSDAVNDFTIDVDEAPCAWAACESCNIEPRRPHETNC